MFKVIRYRWALRQLERYEDKITKTYKKRLQVAYKEKNPQEELQQLRHAEFADHLWIEDERQVIVTEFLIRKASRLFIPVDEEQMWTESSVHSRRVLSQSGITVLRSAIRQEEHDRLDAFLPWASALTGLIGATAGLIAVAARCSSG